MPPKTTTKTPKILKTLDEHNREALVVHAKRYAERGNGIACPVCGTELLDSSPSHRSCTPPGSSDRVSTGDPPEKSVYCPADACEYFGNRFA